MLMRNLVLFRFPTSIDFSEVESVLPYGVLKPVGSLEMNSRGFISPFGREEQEHLSCRQGNFLWLTVGGEDKILPGAVVNRALDSRLQVMEQEQGESPRVF